LTSELTNCDVLIAKLQHQLSGLRRHQLGARSETIDQLELSLEEQEIARAAEAPAPAVSGMKAEKPKRRPSNYPPPERLAQGIMVLRTAR